MIPKIAHVVWNHKNVLTNYHPFLTNGLHNLISMNPDWAVTVYTPKDIEYDLRHVLSDHHYNLVKNRHFVSKIDLWRQFKMYFEGGFYMDIDRLYNIPLSDIIDDGIKWVLPITKDYDFSCDIMLSAPNNPAFMKVAELYLNRVDRGWNDQYLLGPQTYMHGVSHTLSGKIVDTDPGAEQMNHLRSIVREHSFIKTYTEYPPGDTITYAGPLGSSWEQLKRDFYASEGVKHWTGEW